ncbi:MAG: BlaI/MecI/CopY family transcriptional regulator [Kordiimonadales bacterium]|nr:MAG: BlaI/MecI/CopY family transcriptional regulator [Kordiimonadales bacterium]
MTQPTKSISIAESKIMETLWRAHPLTADDIIKEVASQQNWSAGTVKSLLNRLLSKDAISAERDGRRFLYSPLLAHDDYVNSEGQGLLDRLFEGRVSSLFAHFSKHEQLSANDINDIKKIIAEIEDDQ